MSSTPEVKSFNPENHPPLAPTYSQISIVPISTTTKLVSIAGQTGTSIADAHNVSFQDQVRRALANVDVCLAAAGASKSSIVSLRQYVVKMSTLRPEDAKARGSIISAWWKDTEGNRAPPPSTLIGVDSLVGKDITYEIECACVVSI